MDKALMKNALKKWPFEEIAVKGEEIYSKVKDQYEPTLRGKFLAINIESAEIFMGDTLGEAMDRGVEKYPDKPFYLARVGFDYLGMI